VAGWIQLSARTLEYTTLSQLVYQPLIPRLTSAFKLSGERSIFAEAPKFFLIHPDLGVVLKVLRNPVLQPILPPSLQTPISIYWNPTNQRLLRPNEAPKDMSQIVSGEDWGTFESSAHHRVGETVSQPFQVTSAALEFSIIVTMPQHLAEISLVEESTGRTQSAAWSDLPTDRWANIYFKTQPGLYRLKVASRTATGWLALSAPRKLGGLSYYARIALGHCLTFVWLSAAGFAVAVFGIAAAPSAPREGNTAIDPLFTNREPVA